VTCDSEVNCAVCSLPSATGKGFCLHDRPYLTAWCARSSLGYHISADLAFLTRIDYRELQLATTEVKRTLASLIAKINAEHRKV